MILKKTDMDLKKARIKYLISNGFITEKNIQNITNKSYNEMALYENSLIEVNRQLFKIYVQPYLVCFDKPYFDIDVIAKLMIKRYGMELKEAEYMLKEGYINIEEFNRHIESLTVLYFNTSQTGQKIHRYYCDEFSKDRLLFKEKTRNKTKKRFFTK